MNNIDALARKVANARLWKSEARAKYDALLEAFNRKHSALLAEIEEASAACAAAEEEARAAVLEHFAKTGEKKPHPAFGIRVKKILQYDTAQALAWVIERGIHEALKLDTRRFEKIARSLDDAPVTVVEEATATISRDLSAYIEGRPDE